jgi:hypothetical protein
VKGYDARVAVEFRDFARNRIRLLVVDRDTGGALREDGSWTYTPDGVALEPDAGIVLPAEALDAIARAIDEHRGLATHGPTEVRVLREALDVERRRVDEALRRGTGSGDGQS